MRNDDVEMLSEDLAISVREVSVRFRFLNRSDKDVAVLVEQPSFLGALEAFRARGARVIGERDQLGRLVETVREAGEPSFAFGPIECR